MSPPAPHVVIIGSINMDLVARVPHVPAPGETVLGRDFSLIPGGKGANQAVAAARLGAPAAMVGRVGDDDLGPRLLDGLNRNGVDCSYVCVTPDAPSGIAMIVVAENGQNAITVASGANHRVTPADVEVAEPMIRSARVCLLQLELPVETVVFAIELCRRLGVEAILDPAPAPAPPVPAGLLAADIVSPNEAEAAALTGLPPTAAPHDVSRALLDRGCRAVVLKLGERGAYLHLDQTSEAVPGFSVRAVDTTAAGDAFTAALAVARARGEDLSSAIRFANAAGALACTQWGAQPSMPLLADVEAFLRA